MTSYLDLADCLLMAERVLGTETGTRSLDAMHLAAAERLGAGSVPIVTFDLRLAQAARVMGFAVLGA